MAKKLTLEEFIQRAKLVHGNNYDYSKTIYINTKTKIIIICPKHGEFLQTISDHLYCSAGCPICKNENLRQIKTKTFEFFVNKANIVHNFYYDYSKVKKYYIHLRSKVPIICPIHGEFWTKPYNHINAPAGCPKCKSSKGELQIEKWLKKQNIKFITQKRFEKCRYKNTLPFDFYLPELNTCIEFDGEQHFKPVCFNGMKSDIAKINFIKTKENDKIKNKFCKENNITLIRISYKDNINLILKLFF